MSKRSRRERRRARAERKIKLQKKLMRQLAKKVYHVCDLNLNHINAGSSSFTETWPGIINSTFWCTGGVAVASAGHKQRRQQLEPCR